MDPEKKAEQTAQEQRRDGNFDLKLVDLPDEQRARKDGMAATIEGYSSTFWLVDSYWTAMHPQAFDRTLRDRADLIPLLYQHNPDINIGIPTSQSVDEKGLKLEADIFDDGADGSTLARRLKLGARFGFSFGFRLLNWRMATEYDPLDFSQEPNLGRKDVVVYTEVKLYEHSVVSFPANQYASIDSVRSAAIADALAEALDDLRAGRLTDRERNLLREISVALDEQPDGEAAPLPVSRHRNIDASLALARLRMYGV
jgi:HK97 family phage prohead protease